VNHIQNRLVPLFSVIFFSCILSSCVANETLSPTEVTSVSPDSIRHVDGNVFSGGQPTQAEFSKLRDNGIKTVINLRLPSETDWDEQTLLSDLGINYINLPIDGAAGISEENARALMSLIDKNDDEPLIVHCGSGNRVGALIAIAESKINQSDIETSIKEGKRWGLTSLETKVRETLSCTSC